MLKRNRMGVSNPLIIGLAGQRYRQFERATRAPVESQQEVLHDILRRAAGTEWGRRYGFQDLRTPEAFRNRVPITPYEGAASAWHRAFEGDRDVAWPGHVRYFAMSSGTTAGNKLVPVTRDAIQSNRKSGAYLLSVLVRSVGPACVSGGKFFYLGGSTTLRRRGRCWHGDASGIMGLHIPFYARWRYLPDRRLSDLADWEAKIRLVVERYRSAGVAVLSACPSWALLLLKALREAAGVPVGQVWARLRCFVSYGMAFGPYRNAFEEYVGRPLRYLETYSSSEAGMTAIQEEEGAPMRLIVDNGVFFEFVPAERAGEANPPRLHIGEVEAGRDYALVISTNGGIWAYPLGDVVRFESLKPPRIAFAGRTQLYLSAFGEHVDLWLIEKAVASACAATGAVVADYTVAARLPTAADPKPGHQWLVEFDRPPADDVTFMSRVDAEIRKENEDYDTHRTADFGMSPPRLVRLPRGTFYGWMKRKGKLGGQHKVPRVARSPEMVDELVALQ